MKDRIRLVMERAQLSQQDFARKLEISPASLSSIFTGRTNPTNNHVSAVHRAFPDINVNWLMFGEGDMYLPTAAGGSGENAAEGAGAEGTAGVEPGTMIPATGAGLAGAAPDLYAAEQPSLFSAPAEKAPRRPDFSATAGGRYGASAGGGSRDSRVNAKNEGIYGVSMKNIDILPRKIKEIRVFFDDGTYESFVPSGK